MKGRRFLVPEVIQTSAMDCGPAALAALLGGFGVPAAYSRLREACQTGVDGTSIDTLEDIARVLGLDATQLLLPADHVAAPDAGDLPAIALTRTPQGILHFVVIWRRWRGWLQLMDPAVGRRWTRVTRFRRDLAIHDLDIPAAATTGFASSTSFGALLIRRMRDGGMTDGEATRLLEEARARGPEAVYALDAATRAAARAGAGHRVIAPIAAGAADDPEIVPAGCWFARPAGDGPDDGPLAHLRGAVLVSVGGLLDEGERAVAEDVPELLREVADEPGPTPIRDIVAIAGGGRPLVLAAVVAVLAGAVGTAVGLLGRRALDGGSAGPLAAVAWVILLLELGGAGLALRLGRRVEAAFRLKLFHRVPRLPDHYFRSRPTSDSAERAHRVHVLHELPALGVATLRAAAELLVVSVALIVIEPGLAPFAVAAAVIAVGIPAAAAPLQQERDLRVRSHGGALARSWLDAVAGCVPLRAHRAERVIEHDNETLLTGWVAAAGAARRLATSIEGVQAAVGVAFAVALVARADALGSDGPEVLLVAFWAMRVVSLGAVLAGALRAWPLARAVLLRFVEPLHTPVEVPDEVLHAEPGGGPDGGAAIELAEVVVEASGNSLLDRCDVTIAPGEHVAVVGASGAGKSTLAGVLLGYWKPSAGEVRVDGHPLDPAALVRLRRATAWVAPDVALWRGSLVENVGYGCASTDEDELASAHDAADLASVLASLRDGWDSPLGDAGRRLSGGEGQRVRLARALRRPDVRLAVLDEAFRGLPAEQRTRLLTRCRARWSKATLLHITHDLEDVMSFGRVLVVDDGRIVEDGDPAVLGRDDTSKFRTLLDADRRRLDDLAGAGWRQLELNSGQLHVGSTSERGPSSASTDGIGGARPAPRSATDAQLDALRAAAPRWWPCDQAVPAGADLFAAAAAFGLRAERVFTTRERLGEALADARRAVVCHADGAATSIRRGRVDDLAALADHAVGVAARPTGATTVGLSEQEAAALASAEAADEVVPGVWRVRLDPAVALRQGLRWAGVPGRVLGFGLAHVVEIAAYVVAFGILGRAALDGGVTGQTIAGFALALAAAVPARAASIALGQRVAVDAGRVLKQRLLRGALSLSPEASRGEGAGRVMGRIVEAEAVEDQAVNGALGAVIAVVELVAAAGVLAAGVSGPAAVAVLVAWAGLAAAGMWMLAARRRAWASARLEVSLDLVEKLLGHRTRAVQQPPELWSTGEADLVSGAQRASARVDRVQAALLAGLAPAWLAITTTGLAFSGVDDIGRFATSIGGVLLAAGGLERLGRGSADIAGALAAFDACRPLLRAATELPDPPETDDASPSAVVAHRLALRYEGQAEPVFVDVSLTIDRGDRVVLRGPSGAGKSTLASVLAGLREPDHGTVTRAGDVVLAAQFHENHVFLAPIALNLLLGRGWPHAPSDLEAAVQVCTALGLDRVIRRMPAGFEQPVGETGWQLSHGETHLLNVARALLQGGDVVVLDESLGALDPTTAHTVLDALGDAAPAVVVIAQA